MVVRPCDSPFVRLRARESLFLEALGRRFETITVRLFFALGKRASCNAPDDPMQDQAQRLGEHRNGWLRTVGFLLSGREKPPFTGHPQQGCLKLLKCPDFDLADAFTAHAIDL